MRLVAIIDDDAPVRLGLAGLVRSFGYSVCTFASAEEFLRSSDASDSACLITDVQMPGMDGVELQSTLLGIGRSTPMIFITGFPEDRIRERVIRAGAVAYLCKPFGADALWRSLELACADRS